LFFTFPEDARWNVEMQAVVFGVEIGEYRGVVRVPRRVFQRLLPDRLTPERCLEAYYLQRTRFERDRRAQAPPPAIDRRRQRRDHRARPPRGAAGRLERPSVAQLPSATAIEWAARDLGASK